MKYLHEYMANVELNVWLLFAIRPTALTRDYRPQQHTTTTLYNVKKLNGLAYTMVPSVTFPI